MQRLPDHGWYKAALADDEDYARRALATPHTPRPMTMAGYDAVVARLDTLIDVLVAAHSSGGTPPRMPRPVTAADRLEAQNARNRHRARVAQIRGPAATA